MRILIDIVHPANVLFFLRPIRELQGRGDDVLILSRHKDVACGLLDSHGLEHQPITTAGSGVLGLLRELIQRDLSVWSAARRFRPDIMIGFGGVAISHAGKASGTPAIAFYDTEVARLQTSVAWPFLTQLYVPDVYTGNVPAGRTTRVPGIKELSYFHPSGFKPDPELARRAGWEPGVDNFLVRTVSWRANHDIGKRGWSTGQLIDLVDRLSARGRVHISSEGEIPEELVPWRYRGDASTIHHLLGHCRLYVGESATMACEAAIMGTPSIYASNDYRGYIESLAGFGLVRRPEPGQEDWLILVEQALVEPIEQYRATHDSYINGKPDWARVVVDALDRHA